MSQSSAAWPLRGLELSNNVSTIHIYAGISSTPLLKRDHREKQSEGPCLLIWLSQQALQAQQHSRDVVDGAPLVLENVQTDPAREVDVGVIDRRLEEHGWRAVGVVGGELHGQLEDEAIVGGVGGAIDGGGPDGHVLVVGEGGDTGRGLHHDVHEFLLEAERC